MNYYNAGDKVMVKMTKDGCAANYMLKKFEGMEMRVTKRKIAGTNGRAYYELEGAVSDKGTPYGFLKEWLVTI